MENFKIRKIAVLGAGVMGAQIAAHCVNAQIPVILFDLATKEGPKNTIAQRAIDHLKKMSPAPLADAQAAQYLQAANYETDLSLLQQCDLVIEAIAERMDWKQNLYKQVSPYIAKHAIFTTNTSGLSINILAKSLPEDLKPRFCGVHFFNPPRYMHLVELIATNQTQLEIFEYLETFLVTYLGKGVVHAKDTPNFIANRVGVFGMLAVMIEAKKYGLPFDVVDELTGSRLGRAKSATYRTADVVGLDTLGHVIKTMQDGLPDDPFFSAYALPEELSGLIALGALGQKTKAGFYKKEGKQILVFDSKSKQYQLSVAQADPEVLAILQGNDMKVKLQLLRTSTNPQAQFLWAIFRDIFHYSAFHLESIADSAGDIDFALRWGFGWSQGPFETWQAAGWQIIAQWVQADILAGRALCAAPLPDWVLHNEVASNGVHTTLGSWSPTQKQYVARSNLPVYRKQICRAPLFGQGICDNQNAGQTVQEDLFSRLWTASGYEDVLIATLKTKGGVISLDVLSGLLNAVDLAQQRYQALVIDVSRDSFSGGIDYAPLLSVEAVGSGVANNPVNKSAETAIGLHALLKKYQAANMVIKYSTVPVVAAVSGVVIGGGCELISHAAHRVVHLESMVGLLPTEEKYIPTSGGIKEMAWQAAMVAQAYDISDATPFLKARLISTFRAKLSKNAIQAQRLGYLKASDSVVFNAYELLGVAIAQAQQLAYGAYRPPMQGGLISVVGGAGCVELLEAVQQLYDAGSITDQAFVCAQAIAKVVSGGGLAVGSVLTEDDFLMFEREFFVNLLTSV